jgi:hypothetical protein
VLILVYHFTYNVVDTEPVFFYDAMGDACNKSSMVGVINEVSTACSVAGWSNKPTAFR